MRILAIDPGLGRCGYAVVDTGEKEVVPVTYGAIETYAEVGGVEQSIADRLVVLHGDINTILKEYAPEGLAIEHFTPSPAVAHQAPMVLQARGVIVCECHRRGMPVYEYGPSTIKLTVTGNGRAHKGEVQQAIAEILDLPAPPRPDDAADALAIAYTHAQSVILGV